MIRLSTLFWLVVVSTAGFAMFAVKYEVQALADGLARTVKQDDDTERDIRVLDAEWAYLNRPDALAQMNQRILSLVPIATKQLRTSLTDVPMRPAPPPPPPPPAESVVADATLAPAPPAAAPPPDADVAPRRPAEVETPPARLRTADGTSRVVTVALDTHVASQSVKPVLVKAVARTTLPRRAASLDELIAQIAESR
jgi:hypothetical protein